MRADGEESERERRRKLAKAVNMSICNVIWMTDECVLWCSRRFDLLVPTLRYKQMKSFVCSSDLV